MADDQHPLSPLHALECLKDLLADLPNIFLEFDRNIFNSNEAILQCMERRATELCSILSVVRIDLARLNMQGNRQLFGELNHAFDETVMLVHSYRKRFQEILELSPLRETGGTQFHLDTDSQGSVGRPKVNLSKEQVSALIALGFKFTEISSMLGVHPKTLRRLRREWDLPVGASVFTEITDEQLDEVVSEILHELPNTGERLMMGALMSRGLNVQRERMLCSLQRLDPVGRALRRRLRIRRRVYNVPCANFLW